MKLFSKQLERALAASGLAKRIEVIDDGCGGAETVIGRDQAMSFALRITREISP